MINGESVAPFHKGGGGVPTSAWERNKGRKQGESVGYSNRSRGKKKGFELTKTGGELGGKNGGSKRVTSIAYKKIITYSRGKETENRPA